MGGRRSKERHRKSELVLGSTYQIFEWHRTTRIEILIGKQIELTQIEFSRKVLGPGLLLVVAGLSEEGERKWVERNGSNRPPVPWVESSPFRNWVAWTWVDLEKCQVQGRQHIDFDPSPFEPIRPQSIRLKLFDQKGRPNSFRPISFDPFHAIRRKIGEEWLLSILYFVL